jgi:hypothetical protein
VTTAFKETTPLATPIVVRKRLTDAGSAAPDITFRVF